MKNIKKNLEFDYIKYDKECNEILNYFDSLRVFEKINNEFETSINCISEDPLLYEITLLHKNNWLILKNYPKFQCIFLFDVSLENQYDIFKNYCKVGRLDKSYKMKLKKYYKNKLNFDFLEFTEFELFNSMIGMNDNTRVKCNIKDVDLDKILLLKEFMEMG